MGMTPLRDLQKDDGIFIIEDTRNNSYLVEELYNAIKK